MQPPDDEIDVRDDPGPRAPGQVVDIRDAVYDGDDIEILHRDETEVVEAEVIPIPEAVSADPVSPDPRRRPPVDPRIRARRIAVAREQGRRRLRVVLVLLSLIVVVGSAWLVVHSPFLDLDHIEVTGVPKARVASIIAASGVNRSDPLLLLSTGKVARRLEQVPGIGSVRVSRDFPGTLRISVRERGIALWTRVPAGGVALVGHDGRVIRYATAPPAGVSELRGVKRVPGPGSRIVRAEIVDVLDQLPNALAARVGAMSAATADDVRLYLIAGGEVRFGDLSSLHDKAVVAEAVIVRIGCPFVYVDVRSLSNPVTQTAPGAACNQ